MTGTWTKEWGQGNGVAPASFLCLHSLVLTGGRARSVARTPASFRAQRLARHRRTATPNKSLHRTAAQRLAFGCAGSFGRRIPYRRPLSAAVGELWRSPAEAHRTERGMNHKERKERKEGDVGFRRVTVLRKPYHGRLSPLRSLRSLWPIPSRSQANKSVEATATRSPVSMVELDVCRVVWGRRASPWRSAKIPGRDSFTH